MRIGIIGAGNVGATLARLAVDAGHHVMLANSRGPESLAGLVAELGRNAGAGNGDEVARFGEVVVLAAPWRAPDALPSADAVAAKVVVDAMNAYAADGSLVELEGPGSSERTQDRLPDAHVVKAFNTIWYRHLAEGGRKDLPVDDRRAVFLAGNDASSKAVVAQLITDLGFAPVDTGSLADGDRLQSPGSEIYNRPISGRDAAALIERLRS